MKAVHFGAGNIGRGLIGAILSENNYEVCFIDVNESAINQVNTNKFYNIELIEENHTVIKVGPVSGINSSNRQDNAKAIEKIKQADLITTSTGIDSLRKIAPLLAKGLIERSEESKRPVDIIANENAINASSLLKKEIESLLTKEKVEEIFQFTGFPNSVIDRQALSKRQNEEEIALVEPYYEWIVNLQEVVNKLILNIKGITFVNSLEPFIERKLYCVNAGHATAAYTGFIFGKATIQESLGIPEIRDFVRKTMKENAQYLIESYGMTSSDLEKYIEKTLGRHANPLIYDTVLRVGRSPIRKLGYDERLIAPLRKLFAKGLPIDHIIKAIAAVFFFEDPEDPEATFLKQYREQYGIKKAITHYTGLQNEYLIKRIQDEYKNINKSKFSILQ